MQHSDDSNQYEIENKILELQQDVREFWATLNEQGIWLFLATLGCWSVTDQKIQRFAILAIIIIFGETTTNILKNCLKGSTFNKRAEKIKQSIEKISSAEDWRNEHMSELSELQKNEKPSLKWLIDYRVYFISIIFYGLSFLELVPKHP
jgi:hypothetical protein